MQAMLTVVQASPEGFGFGFESGKSKKAWQFETKKDATKARARLKKLLKSKGVKIYYV